MLSRFLDISFDSQLRDVKSSQRSFMRTLCGSACEGLRDFLISWGHLRWRDEREAGTSCIVTCSYQAWWRVSSVGWVWIRDTENYSKDHGKRLSYRYIYRNKELSVNTWFISSFIISRSCLYKLTMHQGCNWREFNFASCPQFFLTTIGLALLP